MLSDRARNFLFAGGCAVLLYRWATASSRRAVRNLGLDRVLPAASLKLMGEVARRCAAGCQTWPAENIYSTCPACGEPTKLYRGLKPPSDAEAKSLAKHAAFELFYKNEHVRDADPESDIDLADLGLRA